MQTTHPNKTQSPQWALPPDIVRPDTLKARINIYSDSIILEILKDKTTFTRIVSAEQIANVLNGEISLVSGILPDQTLWWQTNALRSSIALWREPQVWKAALMVEPLQPPRRFNIPMPGLVFICQPALPPWIFAAKHRPVSMEDTFYNAPTFNTFTNGKACQGSHVFPQKVDEIPESFFTSFFSQAGNTSNRSVKHPKSLIKLWEEIDGQEQYPMDDLVPYDNIRETIRKIQQS